MYGVFFSCRPHGREDQGRSSGRVQLLVYINGKINDDDSGLKHHKNAYTHVKALQSAMSLHFSRGRLGQLYVCAARRP